MNAEPLLEKQRIKKRGDSFHLCMDVVEDFAKICGVKTEEVTGKSRRSIAVGSRHLAMHALANLGVNKRYICQFFNRNRTTIYHSLEHARNMLDTEDTVNDHTNEIINKYDQRRI